MWASTYSTFCRKPVAAHNRDMGAGGENRAARFLEERDFTILERNYRWGKNGEIDIIARRDNLILFVEVKNRASDRYGGALYSISKKKKNSLILTARAFLAAKPEYNDPGLTLRFDMISFSDCGADWITDMFR